MPKQPSNTAPRRWAMAGLLLGLFLFVLAMAQFESLHKAVHADAGKPQHECAVTMLQGGQVDAPGCAVAIVSPTTPPVALLVVESFFVPSVDYSLPPSCGPPALLA